MTGEHLEELKYTDKSSYSLRIAVWKQLRDNATRAGREPRLIIDFPQHHTRLIVTEEPYPG